MKKLKKPGRNTIFVGFVVAVIGLFLPWITNGETNLSGFQAQGYIFLIPLVYPLYKVARAEDMGRNVGIGLSALGFFLAANYVGAQKTAAGKGAFLFLGGLVIFTMGNYVYSSTKAFGGQIKK